MRGVPLWVWAGEGQAGVWKKLRGRNWARGRYGLLVSIRKPLAKPAYVLAFFLNALAELTPVRNGLVEPLAQAAGIPSGERVLVDLLGPHACKASQLFCRQPAYTALHGTGNHIRFILQGRSPVIF